MHSNWTAWKGRRRVSDSLILEMTVPTQETGRGAEEGSPGAHLHFHPHGGVPAASAAARHCPMLH